MLYVPFSCILFSFLYAKYEYAGCDTTLNPNAGTLAASSCTTPCQANPFELCGGTNAMNIYRLQNVPVITTALFTLTTAIQTVAALVNTVTSSNVETVGPVSQTPA